MFSCKSKIKDHDTIALLYNITSLSVIGNFNWPCFVRHDLDPTKLNAATNFLHEIDRRAQTIVERFAKIQSDAGAGAVGLVNLSEDSRPLFIERTVSLQELRRLKRSFLRLVTKTYFNKLPDVQAADNLFIDFLREHIST